MQIEIKTVPWEGVEKRVAEFEIHAPGFDRARFRVADNGLYHELRYETAPDEWTEVTLPVAFLSNELDRLYSRAIMELVNG